MIKRIVSLFIIVSMLISCNKKKEVHILTAGKKVEESAKRVVPADGKYPVMTFEKTDHNFGTIEKDSKVEYTFNFKNTGEADLIIERAYGSCGCTIPEYPKGVAIKPGAASTIKVSFNSKGKDGEQHKSVTILTNTEEGAEKLTIQASIKE